MIFAVSPTISHATFRVSRMLVCALCLFGASVMAFSPSAQAADWLYTVRPGDKLWSLADKFCGSYTYWSELAKHNQLTQPTRLQPGTRLRIPLEWLIEEPASVRVIYARGDTQLQKADGTPAQPLSLGDTLTIEDTLITGDESYANIQFADGSTLQIGPNSELVFDTLSAYRDTGMVDSRVRINRGSASSEVKRQLGPGSVYRISTPLGVAAVRGTEFRTRTSGDANFVETVGGAVEFLTTAGSTDVSKGFGLKADPDGVSVEELLAAPSLNPSARPLGTNERVAWSSLTGAASYLVRIYSGPNLSEVLGGATVPTNDYALASLAPGSYVLGVRGVAASGLQGLEAVQPITVSAALATPEGLLVKNARRRRDLQVSWQPVEGAIDYEVVATPIAGGDPILRTTTASELQLLDLPVGGYSVAVQARADAIQSDASESVEGRVTNRRPWGIVGIVLAAVIAL